MEVSKAFPSLRQVFLRLVLIQLLLPMLFLGLIAFAGVSYLGVQDLETQQYQIAQSMSHLIEHHVDHAGRIMNAVVRTAEISGTESLSVYMKSTWEAYGYFDSLYYLDETNRIKLLMPSDPCYSGLDMSNLPDFQQTGEKKSLIISRPFISLSTGEPTVYLVKPISQGGSIIGELNLGLIQQEITKIPSRSGKDFIFVMDQSGTLLAHPSADLVKQQTNLSNLEIFHCSLAGKVNAFYLYNGIMVLGSAVRIEKTGWVVVDQVPISVFLFSYAWTFGLLLLAFLVICLSLVLNIRKQLKSHVIEPLEQLSQETNALTAGDYRQVKSLSSIPMAFAELNELVDDFIFMSNNLQIREDVLEKTNARLEEEIIELNNTKVELIKAREAAENANIAKSNFVANISHELRTPITVILCVIQLMEMNIRNDGAKNQLNAYKHIKTLKQNCYRLMRLVNNIIDVTKIDAGFMDLHLKNLNIVHLIEEVTASVAEYGKAKGIKIIFDTDDKEIIMAVDSDKIERILLNLLSNSIKFTQRNGNILVSIYNKRTNVIICVEDTGIGIPEEQKLLIFERFQQVDHSFTRKNEGSGIGLSIVKAFVELHEGRINVLSELGKGSSFTIELPVKILDNEQFQQDMVQNEISMRNEDMTKIEFSDIYL